MNVQFKSVDAVNAIITVTVEKNDYSAAVEKTLKDYRKKANIPGFRPGMAPVGMVKKMYGKGVMADEVNKVISNGLFGYIKDNNLDVLGEPLPNEELQKDINFDIDENFELAFDVALVPAFEPEFSKNDKLPIYQIEVDEDMINNRVEQHCSRYGSYVDAEAIVLGDVIKGNLVEVAENGIVVEDSVMSPQYMSNKDQQALFVGAKVGDIITFKPQEAFDNESEIASLLKVKKEDIPSLTSEFTFAITKITRNQPAELNAELFDKIYEPGTVTDEAGFRQRLKEEIEKMYALDIDYKLGLDIRDMLVAKMKDLVFPTDFLKRWLLATNERLTAEEVEKEFDSMLEDLKWQLLKTRIGKIADIKIENEDVLAYARQMAQMQFAQYGMDNAPADILDNYAQDMLKKNDMVEKIATKVMENKVVDFVKNGIELETKSISYADFNKMF